MKRFNLSQIMNTAHKLNRQGKYTWSECLKKAWKMAKFNVWMKEEAAEREAKQAAEAASKQVEIEKAQVRSILFHAELEAKRIMSEAKEVAKRLQMEQEAKKQGITYDEYQSRVSLQMGYGCGSYCGD